MIRVNFIVNSVFLLIATSISLACSFDSGWITYTQPNGIKFIARTYGDEYKSHFETKEGFSLEKNYYDGYYYYAGKSEGGRFILTNLKVGIDQPVGLSKNLVKINHIRKKALSQKSYSIPTGTNRLSKTSSAIYTIKVLLIEFNDVHGRSRYTSSNFVDMLSGSNYIMSPDKDTSYGSLSQYYNIMTNGQVIVKAIVLNNTTKGDKPIWVRLPHNKNDYKDSLDIFADAYAAAVDSGFDMTTDETTKIANIYAGNYYSGNLNPSYYFNEYLMCEVWGGVTHYNDEDSTYTFAHIGIHCHEFGHTLGLVDIYDSGHGLDWSLYGNGDKMGNTIPSKGQCPAPIDPFQRDLHNWIYVQTPTVPNTGLNLVYDGSNPTIYKIESNSNWYYFENRRYNDYSRYCPGYESYKGSGGILVWRAYSLFVDIVEADSLQTLHGKYGDLWPGSSGKRYMNDFTNSFCRLYDGENSSVIMYSVSDPGETMNAIIGGMWFGNLPISFNCSGTIQVGGNLTIPSGITLNIGHGSTLQFYNGSSLIVNGSLITKGGSATTPIKFDFISPNSTTSNGIIFNGNSNSTISFSQILNADRGIYENGVNVNISNCTISNCTDGIFMYKSNPIIQNNNIQNNSYNGLYLIYSSPYLYNNYLKNNGYGVFCTLNSNPKFGNGAVQGNNEISNNAYGILCWNNSYPMLGNNSPMDGGFNNFNNYIYNIYNISLGSIFGMYNWWGTTVPYNFQIGGDGKVITSYFLKQNESIPNTQLNKAASVRNTYNISGVPLIDQLNEVNELITENNLEKAKTICMNLITENPDSSVSFNALNLLKETYTADQFNDLKYYYYLLFDPPVKKDLSAIAGLILADIDKENKLSWIDQVINTYRNEIIVELAFFDKFIYYFFEKHDRDNAVEISKELDALFPLSHGSVEMHRILRDNGYNIPPNFGENLLKPIIPTKYALVGNYPNPFNPTTKINYQLPKDGFVLLKVYDILGREVATLVNENKQAGNYLITFDASKLSSGVYIYTIRVNDFFQSKKMISIK